MLTNRKTPVILLLASLLVFAFFLLGWAILENVYRYAVAGAIFEILWLPMMASLVLIPTLCVLVFIKSRGVSRIYSALSFLFIVGSIIIIAV